MLYIVRHGETEWSKEKKIQGRVDVPLNEKGRQQAIEIKEKLQNEKIDLIISNSLKRTAETAKIISEDSNITLVFDDRIMEREFGEFTGEQKQELPLDAFWDYEENLKYKTAENIRDFFERIFLFLDSIKDECKDKNILLVVNGGVCAPIHCYFNGIQSSEGILSNIVKHSQICKYNYKY